MAERVIVRRIASAIVSLAALGTAAGPVWARPQPASGDQTALRAEAATASVEGSTRRETGGSLATGHRSQPMQWPGTTATRVLPTTTVHGVDLPSPGRDLPVGMSQPSPPADYTPVTDTIKGRVGDTVVVRLGVSNLGPGSPNGGVLGSFAVVPPPGTTITSIPWEGDDDDRRYSCRPPQDTDNYFFWCDLSERRAPSPGFSTTIGFRIRIDKRIPGAKGSITVYGPNDPVPGNDRDAIPVEAAPAPLWRWRNPLWHWQHWAPAAGVLVLVAPAGRWFVRRRREGRP